MAGALKYAAQAEQMLKGFGVHQLPEGSWAFTDVHTASTAHIHHSQQPAALAGYSAVDDKFAAGRFPGYTLKELVDKVPSMDYPEYAALAMACGSAMPSFASADARARIFGQAVWNIVTTYQLEGCFVRHDQQFPGNGAHYSLRPRGLDWAGDWKQLPEELKTMRKSYRAMTPLQQVMTLTVLRLYNQHKDKIFLIGGCPTKIGAAEALGILRSNSALPAWAHLVTHYAGW